MKYKIIDGSTIVLAGVVSYSTIDKPKSDKKSKHVNINFDIPLDIPNIHIPNIPDLDLNLDFEQLKSQKEKIKEEARKFKEQAKQQAHNYKENYKENGSSFMSSFEDAMMNFGKNMEHWGKTFEKSMEGWGETLDKNLNEFGKNMEKFGEDMNFDVEVDKSTDSYTYWQLESLFKELYDSSSTLKEIDKTPELFYEVQAYDLNTTMNDQLLFIGCHISTTSKLPYHVVSQSLNPDQWLVLKLNADEYDKDWIKRLDTIDSLKDYTVEPYFITRHFRDKTQQDNKKTKIYVPLKLKA